MFHSTVWVGEWVPSERKKYITYALDVGFYSHKFFLIIEFHSGTLDFVAISIFMLSHVNFPLHYQHFL